MNQNTIKMMSVAQLLVDGRKTVKPHVNEVSFVSLAQAPTVSK